MFKNTILFLDLDGTLLSPLKKISKKNLNALSYFSKLGGEIVLSTGKTFANTKKYLAQINNVIDNKIKFCACMNGNIIMDLRYNRERVLYENYISNKDCHFVYHIAKKHHVIFAPYTKIGIENGNIHTTSSSFLFNLINKFNISKWKIRTLNSYQYMLAFKINIFSRNIFSSKKLEKVFNELKTNKDIDVLKTRKFFYEIINKGSDKGYALKFISKILKQPLKNTIAIGDSYNDLPMFKVANTSICVRRQKDEIFQKYCKYFVYKKYNKVAHALDNLFDNQNQTN